MQKGRCIIDIAIITGAAGLIGAEAVRFFDEKGFKTVGIDNGMREVFFGADASTEWSRKALESGIENYTHHDADIRDADAIGKIFEQII